MAVSTFYIFPHTGKKKSKILSLQQFWGSYCAQQLQTHDSCSLSVLQPGSRSWMNVTKALSQVTIPTLDCGIWHCLPLFLGRDFLLTAAPGCSVQLGQLLYAIFQAHFPGMVESRGARNKHWEVVEPTVLMDLLTGKVQSQPCKSQQASAGPAVSFGVK